MRRQRKSVRIDETMPHRRQWSLLRLVPWGLLLLFMAKVGTSSSARHLAPYYAFLFPLFLVKPVHDRVVRQPRWQLRGLTLMAFAAIVVAGAGNRPLLPLPALWKTLHAKFPQNELVTDQFTRYADSDFVAATARKNFLEKTLPPAEPVVGYHPIVCDMDEPALWLPFGRRQVECVDPDDSPGRLRELGIRYVVIHLYPREGGIADWMKKYHATLVGQYSFPNPAATTFAPPELYVVRLD
jgi:hypothetical protein